MDVHGGIDDLFSLWRSHAQSGSSADGEKNVVEVGIMFPHLRYYEWIVYGCVLLYILILIVYNCGISYLRTQKQIFCVTSHAVDALVLAGLSVTPAGATPWKRRLCVGAKWSAQSLTSKIKSQGLHVVSIFHLSISQLVFWTYLTLRAFLAGLEGETRVKLSVDAAPHTKRLMTFFQWLPWPFRRSNDLSAKILVLASGGN